MRTLVYCTAYAQTALLWNRRYRRWVDAILAGGLGQHQVVLVDDGSPVLPAWPDTDIVTVRSLDDVARIESAAPVLLIRFPNRLGRADIYDFPGWYRSFACGARYAVARGFTKVLHIESDAYIVSARTREWLRETQSGWHAPWSAKYEFPEMAIQVIAPDQLANFDAFTRRPYTELIGVTHETALPLTHVNKSLAGDRYGEDEATVPAAADFATQIPAQRERRYYWWLNGAAGPAGYAPGRIDFRFGRGEPGVEMLAEGWAKPEPSGTWMIHALSIVKLPELPAGQAFDMIMLAVPNIQRPSLAVQRLVVQLNTAVIGEFDFSNTMRAGCEVPADLLRGDGTDKLRFQHPDAAQPARFHGNDRRNLAVMLCTLSLQPCAA